MASINIGSLKFNWKGTYNGSTAYAVDDVTEYNGSSYICILASTGNLPTNTTYFQPMATKGTDGTDVGTTLTTQGDILYRDGSGLQRLAAGTANQVLQTGGAGANPSWGTVSSDFVKIASGSHSGGALAIDNCFTATYPIYKVHFYNIDAGEYMRVRFRTGGASGAEFTSSNYRNRTRFWYMASGGTGDTGEADWDNSSMRLGYGGTGGSVNGHSIEMNIYDPYSSTEYVHYHGQRSETGSRAGTAVFGGYVNNSQSMTGIFLYQNNNNSFNCDYAVYGMKV
tara:strand:+ start:632 stop:1477 length:846 start_codon:yes stop_codon:yes gene_type:complete